MTSQRDLPQLRHAKETLAEEYGNRDWYAGAGIAPGADGLELRLNVVPDIEPQEELPQVWEGIPVQVVRISYKPRS